MKRTRRSRRCRIGLLYWWCSSELIRESGRRKTGYRVANQQTVRNVRERAGEYAGDGDAASKRDSAYSLRPNGRLSEQEAEEIEELAQEIGTLAARMHAAEHHFLELIAEFDAREGWKVGGYRNCSEWLHVYTGLDRRTARERVRVARKLASFPHVSEAMRRGQLSFSKVRAILRLSELEDEHEQTVVEFARENTAAELEKLVRWERMGSGEGDEEREAERERRNHASRRFAVFSNDAGMYEIRGIVDPEVGALLMRAIEAASDALYDVAREEPLGPEPPEPEQRRADALGLLAERALTAGFGEVEQDKNGPAGPPAHGGTSAGEPDEAENGPAGPPVSSGDCSCGGSGKTDGPQNGPAGPLPTGTRAERYQVFVHVDQAVLSGSRLSGGNGSAGSGNSENGSSGMSETPGDGTDLATFPNATSPTAHLEDGTRLTPETARRLTCDAALVAVACDGEQKTVLGIGRRSRTIPSAIRRALRVRDGGCRFPGCGLRFIDGHHIHHWADGGPTNMDNLVSLCRFHHRAVHEDGFRVQKRGEGTFKFFSPEGWPLGRERPCIQVDIDDPQVALVRLNRRRGIDPKWMDTAASHRSGAYIPRELLFRAYEAVDGG